VCVLPSSPFPTTPFSSPPHPSPPLTWAILALVLCTQDDPSECACRHVATKRPAPAIPFDPLLASALDAGRHTELREEMLIRQYGKLRPPSHNVQGSRLAALWTNENERAGTHGHRTLRELGFVEDEFLLLILARRSKKVGQSASYPPQWVYMIRKLPFFLPSGDRCAHILPQTRSNADRHLFQNTPVTSLSNCRTEETKPSYTFFCLCPSVLGHLAYMRHGYSHVVLILEGLLF
jgi:hypothetical protein